MKKEFKMELLNSEEARGIKGGDYTPIWCQTVEVKDCLTFELKDCVTVLVKECEPNGIIVLEPKPKDEIMP